MWSGWTCTPRLMHVLRTSLSSGTNVVERVLLELGLLIEGLAALLGRTQRLAAISAAAAEACLLMPKQSNSRGSLSAHTKAVQQHRELVCSHQSSAAAEGACLLTPKQCSSSGSLSAHTKAEQQHRERVCGYQSSAAAKSACRCRSSAAARGVCLFSKLCCVLRLGLKQQ
jgi:hypothetical protein